jgi:DNA-binding transcriptional LysR family regulator
LPTAGGLYAWELQKGTRELHVRVDGQLVFNDVRMLRAAAAGFGLACVPDDHAAAMIADGQLVRVLEDWCPAVRRLPPLLSKPAPALRSFFVGSGRAALLGMIGYRCGHGMAIDRECPQLAHSACSADGRFLALLARP